MDDLSQRLAFMHHEVAASRQETLSLSIGLVGVISYLGVVWALLPYNAPPAGAAVSLVLLGGSAILSYSLYRKAQFTRSSHVLVWGSLVAIHALGRSLQITAFPLLYLLPLMFVTTMLDDRTYLAMTLATSVLALFAGFGQIQDAIMTLLVLGLTTVFTRICVQHLKVTVENVWDSYLEAHKNQQTIRVQQGELRQVVKQLDEATYRLDRIGQQLKHARDQAYLANQLKQQFAQTVSHELRTPLNIIVGFAKLMTESPEYYGSNLPFAYTRDLNILYRNALHLQSLVDDVLDLARIQAAQIMINPQETNLKRLVKDAVDTVRTLLEQKHLKLGLDLEPGLPHVWVDQIRIRQVLFNLLNNAVRFTDQGSITVGAHRQENAILLSVTDTGIGIAPENADRIFKPFQQQSEPWRGGTGLGLAISKEFVELHHGKIWVESHPGQGSTFFFTLPLENPDGAETQGMLGFKETAPARRREEPLLLVVTRSHSATSLLARHLKKCRTIMAGDLDQARGVLYSAKPDAIIIDAAYKTFDIEALLTMVHDLEIPETPVIMCPLYPQASVHHVHPIAVDGYLHKPISQEDLWTVLRQYGSEVDTVLIIDDNRDFVRLFSRMLDHPLRRHRVLSAYSGSEGLEILALHRPDLIFVDLQMPGMNGLEVIRRVRANPAHAGVAIVVVTAQDETDTPDKLQGVFQVVRGSGLKTGEIVQWIQKVLDGETILA